MRNSLCHILFLFNVLNLLSSSWLQAMVDVAKEVGADAVAHGCTGKGNDQVHISTIIVSTERYCYQIIITITGFYVNIEHCLMLLKYKAYLSF